MCGSHHAGAPAAQKGNPPGHITLTLPRPATSNTTPLRCHSRTAAGSGETRCLCPPPPPPPPLHTEEYLLLEIVCQGRHTSAVKLGLPLQVQLQVLLGLAASSIDAWVS